MAKKAAAQPGNAAAVTDDIAQQMVLGKALLDEIAQLKTTAKDNFEYRISEHLQTEATRLVKAAEAHIATVDKVLAEKNLLPNQMVLLKELTQHAHLNGQSGTIVMNTTAPGQDWMKVKLESGREVDIKIENLMPQDQLALREQQERVREEAEELRRRATDATREAGMAKAAKAEAERLGLEPWPPGLEICVEYCKRSAFHARHDPEKYAAYFSMVVEAIQLRSAQTKIVGNEFEGRSRMWKAFDKLGPLAQEQDIPRLGAFEVTVRSEQLGEVTIFSKLETRHWPNPRILILQVDRLLRGEPLLKPVASPRKKRNPNETSYYWSQKSYSPQATPRSNVSPERTPRVEKSSPQASPKKDRKAASGKKESPAPEAAPPPSDSKGMADANETAASASNTFEDAQYEEEGFEGDESGDGSSGLGGTKVWMPGAAKEEKWEEDLPNSWKFEQAQMDREQEERMAAQDSVRQKKLLHQHTIG